LDHHGHEEFTQISLGLKWVSFIFFSEGVKAPLIY